ncbi:MAG: DUF1189 family protein [Patescibacteria group bacterium]
MNIITEIKNSVYNPAYYQDVVSNKSFGSSVKYLAKLALISSLAISIFFAFQIPKVSKIAKEAISTSVVSYPEDLVVTMKNGNASINKPEPYIVKIPQSWQNIGDNDSSNLDNLIVINTKDDFNLETFRGYSTMVLLTKTEFISLKDSSGEIRIIPVSKFGNIEITKSWLIEKQAWIFKIMPKVAVLIIIFMYIAISIGIFLGTLFMLLFYALAIWLMSNLRKLNFSYKKSYQVGLHAVTLVVIVGIISTILSIPDNFFIRLLVLLCVVFLNFPKVSSSADIAKS